MSIIQQIRDKAAWLVFGLIALSLIGFLLMDAFVGRSKFFGNKSTVVGTVNGQSIELKEFEQMSNRVEEQYKMRGMPVNEGMTQNIHDNVWKQLVEDAVFNDDYAALGLDVSDKEVNDMLVGPNAIPDVKQAFTDPKTGVFDPQLAAERINQMRNIYKAGPKKNGDNNANTAYEQSRGFFEESIPQIVKMRLREKFTTLLANSAYVPKWMLEKQNADNSQIASISYVSQPYFTVPDSTVKISDDEISDYVAQHKDQFHQDESRSIAYVIFDASPNAADSAKVRQQLIDFKADFAKSDNPEAFLNRVGSDQTYFDGYMGKSRIQVPAKDSILSLAKGELYGPYLDAGSYVVAKMIDQKTLPDSVRARHILIATNDGRGNAVLDDSSAHRKIDSIQNLIEHGARFDSLAAKLSDDPGSKEKGGDLGYFASGQMVKEFNDFCFDGKTGEKKIVKTQFGYHYIEITDQKNFEPSYKVAYLSKKVETSPETDQAVSGLANQFTGESRDAKSFDENIQKGHLQRQMAPDVTPSEYTIPGVGVSRALVKWIYDASVGNVSEPYSVDNKYVVAELLEINKEGLMSPTRARGQIEPILRNRKKAEIIAQKLKNPASLDAAATATGQSIQKADSVLFSSSRIPNGGQEPKVVGAAFSKSLAGKPVSEPIAGNAGVYIIKVDNVSAVSNPNADLQQERFTEEQRERSTISYMLVETMRKLATVKDDRGKFF